MSVILILNFLLTKKEENEFLSCHEESQGILYIPDFEETTYRVRSHILTSMTGAILSSKMGLEVRSNVITRSLHNADTLVA